MRLLVTNDDGIRAPGLLALVRHLRGAGHDIVVAAPTEDRSGSSAAIGPIGSSASGYVSALAEGIPIEQVSMAEDLDVEAHALDAPPAMIVLIARLGGLGDAPDMVVSGINPGANTGRAVLHSGTVGAALTAANAEISAVAVSIAVADDEWPADAWHWDTAAALAVDAVEWLAQATPGTVLNVNVPNVAVDDIKGVRWASLAPFGSVRAAITGTAEGRLELELEQTDVELDPESDTALVHAGYVAITTITGPRATDGVAAAEFLSQRLPDRGSGRGPRA